MHLKLQKEALIKAVDYLYSSNIIYHAQQASLSARIDDNRFVMINKNTMTNLSEDNFMIVNLDGAIEAGENLSTDKKMIDMHTAIYKQRHFVNSIIHTHALNATAFAISQQAIPLAYAPLLQFDVTENIPVVDWLTEKSVKQIIKMIEDKPGLPALLLANHGLLAFSENPMKTAQLIVTLDEAAELIIKARQIGRENTLPQTILKPVQKRVEEFRSKMYIQ